MSDFPEKLQREMPFEYLTFYRATLAQFLFQIQGRALSFEEAY